MNPRVPSASVDHAPTLHCYPHPSLLGERWATGHLSGGPLGGVGGGRGPWGWGGPLPG